MNSATITAPAKVNLFLKILSKRPDGYHDILTLFERVSLADRIKISKIPSGIIVKSDVFITRDPRDNLVYKASKFILKEAGVKSGVKVEIKKNIPIAAGLGGGSSDAAAALLGINKLFKLQLGVKKLIGIAKKLGADVPFFMLDTPFAVGKGRGDDLRILRPKSRLWHLLIYPGFKVATKDIYKEFDTSRYLTKSPGNDKIHPSFTDGIDFNTLESVMRNDLERVVVGKNNIIGNIIERLAAHLGRKAIVSGSGPSVFCLYRTGKEAIEAKRIFSSIMPAKDRKRWQVFVAKTV